MIGYWNEEESILEKNAKTFDNFTYDNDTNDGVISVFNNLDGKISNIESTANEVFENMNTLLSKYDSFNSVLDTISQIKNKMNDCINDIKNYDSKLMTYMTNTVQQSIEKDEQLNEDLEILNQLSDAGGAKDTTSAPSTQANSIAAAASTMFSGTLHSKSKASDAAKATNGIVTSGNQNYRVVPDGEYTGEANTISESDYNLLIAQVCGESGNTSDDMLGVTSTVLNRLEAGGGFGNSVNDVLEKGYFPWGRSYKAYVPGGKYYETEWGQEKLRLATQVVNQALAGIRNINKNVYYYSGNGEYNSFSDVL